MTIAASKGYLARRRPALACPPGGPGGPLARLGRPDRSAPASRTGASCKAMRDTCRFFDEPRHAAARHAAPSDASARPFGCRQAPPEKSLRRFRHGAVRTDMGQIIMRTILIQILPTHGQAEELLHLPCCHDDDGTRARVWHACHGPCPGKRCD